LQFFTEFGHWDRYPHSTEHILVFIKQFGLAQVGAFRIVSDTLVKGLQLICDATEGWALRNKKLTCLLFYFVNTTDEDC